MGTQYMTTLIRAHFLLFLSLVALFVCVVSLASAQVSDTFIVQTMIGDDTTPPTVPGSVLAIPVASSQIDVSWGTSTDDWVVAGYYVWRDDVRIATTTNLFYSDTGLSPSTTYAYYVTAFDSAGNESASSTEVSATTFALPTIPVEDEEDTSSGTRISLASEIRSLEVVPGQESVVIQYTTTNPIRAIIRYGTGVNYELGSLSEQSFKRAHEAFINGLTPDTLYTFSIEGELGSGRYGVLYTGSFRTSPMDDIFAPGNVMNLHATQDGEGIQLTWNNPNDIDFDHVRVVRSSLFYPTHAADGWLVYEGDKEGVFDSDAAAVDGWIYYTVFAYDANGNMSSGAVTSLRIGEELPLPPPVTGTTTPLTLDFFDVRFLQEGTLMPMREGVVSIDGSKQVVVSIPYHLVPQHLKTIVIELQDPTDPELRARFLLRADSEFTAYTATLAPLGVSGDFPVVVTVFDFATRDIGSVTGIISSTLDSLAYVEAPGMRISYVILFVLGVLALLLLTIRLMYRSSR